MKSISETETVIKKILPYLVRRGYDIDADLAFEENAELEGGKKGFIDVSVNCGTKDLKFLVEAKRDGSKLTKTHAKQAIKYGASKKCLFVGISNGQQFELYNTKNGQPLRINSKSVNILPSRADLLKYVIPQLKKNPEETNLFLPTDKSLPFRPGIPLTKLNHLIAQAHNSIRKIEKNEDHAFSDFSKMLFLKLLEEKYDQENRDLPYSYRFHELADTGANEADKVKDAITSMIDKIRKTTTYGEVLADPIKLTKKEAYLSIVKKIASISWSDCNLDSKGAAFEYFVRATLKGKKLGQYFTPRPLVQLMLALGKQKHIVNALKGSEPFKVLDPACGTGGFLVYALNSAVSQIEQELKNKDIPANLAAKVTKALREQTFYGIDANAGVAGSAKMNMIIAGDGHNNIQHQDSLKLDKLIPDYQYEGETISDGKAHLILTNPPFGTSESESMNGEDRKKYEVKSTKGQALFIQQMIRCIHDDCLIVTVIDEGVLNTSSYTSIRQHILEHCRIEYIISLPDETFKPNKINVKSSLLVLKKRANPDTEREDEYPIQFIKIESLGYEGSGAEMRGFDLAKLIKEIDSQTTHSYSRDEIKKGYKWEGFVEQSVDINLDRTCRFDYKYWNQDTILALENIRAKPGFVTIQDINTITTARGNSPSSSDYVSANEGYALVVKAGSNIQKNGQLVPSGDFIEKNLYDNYLEKNRVILDGDILLASTGDGTLGKCCVYRNEDAEGSKPAIADSHVTVIRVDPLAYSPEFICDYLRVGFGKIQVERLYTGATGLIELTPEDVNTIVLPSDLDLKKQQDWSNAIRDKECKREVELAAIEAEAEKNKREFLATSLAF